MKYRPKRYRSALILQIILAHIHATYSLHLIPRNFFQYSGSNTDTYISNDPIEKDFSYNLQGDKSRGFLREAKSDNQARMFNIDLSRLRHNTPLHKTPVNLLGIDISVLSRNPDPALPLVSKPPKDMVNGKFITGYDFDSRFDRLPVIKTKQVPIYSFIPQENRKATALLPMMQVPLKVLTAYHSILTNKKQDTDFQLNEKNANDDENEQNNTVNFILQLLYQLSSNYNKADIN